MMEEAMDSPRNAATMLIGDVVADLTSARSVNLVTIVRQLQRASGLLGWEAEQTFRLELFGYSEVSIPQHRMAQCAYRWIPDDLRASMASLSVAEVRQVRGLWPLASDLGELINRSGKGYGWTDMGESKLVWVPSLADHFSFRRQVSIGSEAVKDVLARIEERCSDFAIRAERQLRFGEVTTDIFQAYRSSVESELAKIDVGENLRAIEANLATDNAETAKLAILGCRNVLLALADKLWQVPGLSIHPTLKDHSGNALQLGKQQPKARLRSFLHERGVSLTDGRRPTLIATQLDYVADTIDRLYDLSSKQGKNDASAADARSITLQLYVLLGEIARLAGFEPVFDLQSQLVSSAS